MCCRCGTSLWRAHARHFHRRLLGAVSYFQVGGFNSGEFRDALGASHPTRETPTRSSIPGHSSGVRVVVFLSPKVQSSKR